MSKADRGFASMDRDQQRTIASMGGKAAWASGKAHKWDSKAAAEAGRKGGSAGRKGREGLQESGAAAETVSQGNSATTSGN